MTKHKIIAFGEGVRKYLTDNNGTTDNEWTTDETKANVYCDYDMALSDWWEVDKKPFKRVFICNA